MAQQSKPSIWSRITRVFTGKPVTHEEDQAARARHAQDAMTQAQLNIRNQRYSAGGFGM
jgi:hypothetical protein